MARLEGTIKPDFTYEDFKDANGRLDWEAHQAAEEKWLREKKAEITASSKSDIVGGEVRFGVADGYALYIVTKARPFTLVHVGISDAYQALGATIRGYTAADARREIEYNRKYEAKANKEKDEVEAFLEAHAGQTVHLQSGLGKGFYRCVVLRTAEGELVIEKRALVGEWSTYDTKHDSYAVEEVRERKQASPRSADRFWEANEDLQKKYPGIRAKKNLSLPAKKVDFEVSFSSKAEFSITVKAEDADAAKAHVDALLQNLLSGHLSDGKGVGNGGKTVILVSDSDAMLDAKRVQ